MLVYYVQERIFKIKLSLVQLTPSFHWIKNMSHCIATIHYSYLKIHYVADAFEFTKLKNVMLHSILVTWKCIYNKIYRLKAWHDNVHTNVVTCEYKIDFWKRLIILRRKTNKLGKVDLTFASESAFFKALQNDWDESLLWF